MRAGFFHGLHQGYGDDAFGDIRLGCFTAREAAGEVFDVILIFAGVVRVAAEAEEIVVLVLKSFDTDCSPSFQA